MNCLVPVILTDHSGMRKRINIRVPFDPSDPWEAQVRATERAKERNALGIQVNHPYQEGEKVCFLGCCKFEEEL